jgi:conjugative transfer pilus assembly protein TraH
MITGEELVNMANNIGSQAAVYGMHLGLKTYAPQIEQILKDLRNLSMELNQMGIGHCKTVQAGFAALLPQNSAMYETVCQEMVKTGSHDSIDLGEQRKKCKSHAEQKEAVEKKQKKDPEIMMDNYNILVKAATAAGIPQADHEQLMSMVGTIVVKDQKVTPYRSLANDADSWNAHIYGGTKTSMYSCDNATCLNIVINNVNISADNSYAGKAKTRLKNSW